MKDKLSELSLIYCPPDIVFEIEKVIKKISLKEVLDIFYERFNLKIDIFYLEGGKKIYYEIVPRKFDVNSRSFHIVSKNFTTVKQCAIESIKEAIKNRIQE